MTTRLWKVRSLALGLVAVFAVGACGDSPVTDVSQEQDNRPLLKTVLGPGNVVLPGGSVALADTRIQDFDFSVTDGWARAVAPADAFVSLDNPFGAAPAYNVADGVRNSTQDPRLPAVTDDDAAVGGFWGLFNPGFTGVGDGGHDLFGEVTGLEPNTTYSVVLARMSLTVNGELDQNQLLSGVAVDQPDQLSTLGGTPTGYPGVECNFSALSPVTASTNPVMLGFVTTDGDGNATVDCIPFATDDSPWYRSSASQTPPGATMPDSMPFGANEAGASLAPGQYNYVMLYEGLGTATDPTPSENPALRAQVGPDIDASGNVINNGFRPIPTAVPGNFASLPGGADAFAAPGTITLDVSGLPALGGYQVKLFDRDAGTFTPVTPLVSVDGGTESRSGTFASDGSGSGFTLTLDSESGADFGAHSHVALAMAGDDTEFLFAEYLAADKSLLEGAMTFGGFDGPDNTMQFQAAGSGLGSFFGDSLIVDLTRLPATPPEGFHYQSYLTRFDGAEMTGMQRVHTVELDELGNGSDRIAAGEIGGDFGAFNFYVLVLEPDGSPLLTDMQIQISEDYFGKFSGFFSR